MARAGRIIDARRVPGAVVAHVSSSVNRDTSEGEPLELLSTSALLYADLVYEFEGWCRIRHLGSSANDGGRVGTNTIDIDSVIVQVGRSATNAQSNASNQATAIWTKQPRWSPMATGVHQLQLMGERSAGASWSDHLEFRGSGGPHFEYWMSCKVVGIVE